MALKKYGTTWWGRKWLDSLTGIDNANRIPRGLSYARNDKVFGVKTDTSVGRITACVVGHYNPYYKVTLSFDRVDPEQKELFLDSVIKDLGVISRLSNRELDPRLVDIATKVGIKLFPTAWRDVGMSCNCPDFAIPCKHIASVIYVVSELIDTNPFILFDLIGIDLKQELEARGIFNDDATAVETPTMHDLYLDSVRLPRDIVATAKEYDFDINLVPVAPMDAAHLFGSSDLIKYTDATIILDQDLDRELNLIDFQEQKLTAARNTVEVTGHELERIKKDLVTKQSDIAELEQSVKANQKGGRGRPSARSLAMAQLLEDSKRELEETQKAFDNKLAILEQSRTKYNEVAEDINLKAKSCKAKLKEYREHTEEVLRLGYDPELLKEEGVDAALDREDRIADDDTVAEATASSAEGVAVTPAGASDAAASSASDAAATSGSDAAAVSGSDVSAAAAGENASSGAEVGVEVVEAEVVSTKGRKSKGADRFSLGLEEEELARRAEEEADARAEQADEAALKDLPSYIRRYHGDLARLSMLTYVEIPEIGDSLTGLYAEHAKGFTQGNLNQLISKVLKSAESLAMAQLRSKAERDVIIFDEHRFEMDMQRALDIATNGPEEEEEEKDSISAAEVTRKSTRGRKKKKGLPKAALAKFVRQQDELKSRVASIFERNVQWAEPFSNAPIAKSGFFSRHPLFCMSAEGILQINNPILVVEAQKGKSVLKNISVCPDFADTAYRNYLKDVPQFAKYEADNIDSTGLYDLFSGYIQNANMLANKGSEIGILYSLWFIATNLVKKRAIIPQLYRNQDNELRCRWIPAICSEPISDLVTKVGLALQGYEHFLYNRLDRQYYLDPKFIGVTLLSAFIHSYVTWAYEKDKKLPKDIDDLNVLFGNASVDVQSRDVAESSMRMRLEAYFSSIAPSHLEYTPVLRFVDLSNYDEYGNTIFGRLEPEIIDVAMASYEQQMERVRSYAYETGDDSLVNQDGPNSFFDIEDQDYYEDDDIDYDESMSYGSRGIGMELGFTGFSPDKITDIADREMIDDTGFISLNNIVNNPSFEGMRQESLRTLTRLATLAPALEELFSNKYNVAIIPLEKVYSTIVQARSTLQLLGVKVVLPKSLQKFVLPSSTMMMDVDELDASNAVSFLSLTEAVKFNWQLTLGDTPITEDQFKRLLANAGNIVRFNNQFVYADPNILNALKRQSTQSDQIADRSGAKILAAMLTGTYEDSTVLCSDALKESLKRLLAEKEVPLPKGLKATLRPYQQRGYEWMMRNTDIRVGSIIADDMGLGKTVQVISTLLKLKEDGKVTPERPALVVVPTSLITNWTREIAQFAPDLTVSTYFGAARGQFFGETDVILTSYGTARSRIKKITEHEYAVVVIDEAQAIKTITAAVSKALREVVADNYIAMSGTPVENRLLEYYSILDFVNRGLFGTAGSFLRSFAIPIEREHNQNAVDSFRMLTAPFIMRRLKSDKSIIADLPEKMTSDQYCDLTPSQAALYQAVVEEKMAILSSSDVNTKEKRQGMIFSLIAALKAICNSPAQFSADNPDCKPEDSGKVERLFELLNTIMESNGKVLVFTQSVRMGKILQNLIATRFGTTPQFLYGGLSQSARMEIVDKFQNDSSERILLLSLRAAGVGLNLTAANFVIHFDLWWNPAVENQATDRAYRIGQKNNVQVYRLICANTFEERINDMITHKRDLADTTVAAGEKWIGSMTNSELNDLFALSGN